MASVTIQMPPHHQTVVNRFITACQQDERVLAAILCGSYARGAADAYSDLDFALITTEDAYAPFIADKATFIHQLGEPLFLEDFGLPHHIFFIFPDDSEGEVAIGQERHFTHLCRGFYQVLLDKKQLLTDAIFVGTAPTTAEQTEKLQRLVAWFWHDFSHLITALGRGQLWWAHGQIEVLRLMCVNLARLRHNFADPYVSDEYFKVEQALPVAQLSALEATYCPLQQDAMRQAAQVILRFYQEVAPPLARAHGIPYPTGLEQVMVTRLEKLGAASSF